MKNISKFIGAFYFFTALIVYMACKPRAKAPVINFNPTGSFAAPGDTVKFDVSVKTEDANISSVSVYKKVEGKPELLESEITGRKTHGITFTFAYIVELLPSAATISFRFVASADAKDKPTSEKTYVVTIGPSNARLPNKGSQTTRIFDYHATSSSISSSWAIVPSPGLFEGPRFATDPNADKDLRDTAPTTPFFTGRWTSRNGAGFVKARSGFDYVNASASSIVAEYNLGTPKTFLEFTDGDILLVNIRGQGIKYAAVRIIAVNNIGSVNQNNVQFEYKNN